VNDMRDLYQQLILDHYQNPHNKGTLEDATNRASGNNPLCGDHIDLTCRIKGDRIKEIKFEGSGCAISQASASIMTTVLEGKTTGEARQTMEIFTAMVTGAGQGSENLGKLAALADIYKFPARVKCAMLPWRTLEAGLDDGSLAVSTE
jgi:nitrogen fixation NifU-like protein